MTFKNLGIHEIIIRNENDTSVIASGNSELTIDRIDLEVAADTFITTTSSVSSSTVIFASGSSLATSSSSSSPSSSPSQSPSQSPSIGAIVGGVIGGGFVLVSLLLLLFWYRLKQKRDASTENPEGPSPFVTPPGLQQTSSLHPSLLSSKTTTATPPTQNSINSITTPSTNTQYPGRYAGYTPGPGKSAQNYIPTRSPLLLEVSSRSTSQPSPQPSSSQGRREQDAGPLELESPTLPPEYNQVFSHTIHSSSNIPSR